MKIVLLFGLLLTITSISKGQVTDTLEVSNNTSIQISLPTQIVKIKLKTAVGEESVFQFLQSSDSLNLKCKSTISDFSPANASFETKDGRLYNFVFVYNAVPSRELISLTTSMAINDNDVKLGILPQDAPEEVIENNDEELKQVEKYARDASFAKKNIKRIGIIQDNLWFYPTAVYTFDTYIFIRLQLDNKSKIPYEIGSFEVKRIFRVGVIPPEDHKKPLEAVLIYNPKGKLIPAKESLEVVLVFEKFPLYDMESLSVEFIEKAGKSDFYFNISNELILNAEPL